MAVIRSTLWRSSDRGHTHGVAALAATLLVALAGCTPTPPGRDGARGQDPTWLAQVARVCVLRASCAHGHESDAARDPGRCVTSWLAELDGRGPNAAQACLLRAQTCEGAHACEASKDAAAVAFCRAHPGQASACESNALVDCGDDPDEAERVDCATLGGTCQAVRHSGGLTESACVSPTLCPMGAPEGRCEGPGAVVTCIDGAAERIACKPGKTCVARADSDGVARASCELVGAPRCSAPGARYCEGDRLVACSGPRGTEKSAVTVTDCGAAGLRCDGEGRAAGCYVLGKNDCAPDEPPQCDQGAITFCAVGRRVRVACAELGGSGCESARNTSSVIGAACRVTR